MWGNKHWYVMLLDITEDFRKKYFDAIWCCTFMFGTPSHMSVSTFKRFAFLSITSCSPVNVKRYFRRKVCLYLLERRLKQERNKHASDFDPTISCNIRQDRFFILSVVRISNPGYTIYDIRSSLHFPLTTSSVAYTLQKRITERIMNWNCCRRQQN
jgi:hypothetical protein